MVHSTAADAFHQLWPFTFKIDLPQLNDLGKLAEAAYLQGVIQGATATAVLLIVFFLVCRQSCRSAGLCLLATVLLWYAGERSRAKIPVAQPAPLVAPKKPKKPHVHVAAGNQRCACNCGCAGTGICNCDIETRRP